MALVDVTELLVDPDFVDAIQVITRVDTVNSQGENQLAETTLSTVGSVQPASGRTIARLPEEFRVANVSEFWFKGQIVTSSPGEYSSILVFQGVRYEVQTVQNWLNFGAGWSSGTCIAQVPAP